jgi:hypothetical protein
VSYKQATDQRALAVIDAAAGNKAQQILALVSFQISWISDSIKGEA